MEFVRNIGRDRAFTILIMDKMFFFLCLCGLLQLCFADKGKVSTLKYNNNSMLYVVVTML